MATLNGLLARLRPKAYARRPSLVLLNGLAEQPESWFRNRRYWSRFFDVHAPNLLVYDGEVLRHRVATKQPIDVPFLVDQLHTYLTQFVQFPPYHLVGSSMGCKVAVEFAAKYPQMVNRVVLLCPSGMGDKEVLPVAEGLKGDQRSMTNVVKSVFNNVRRVDRAMLRFYETAVKDRKWKRGLIKTTNGTLEHVIRDKLKLLQAPTLIVTGEMDKVCQPLVAEEAAKGLQHGCFVMIPGCGHAPQIERHWLTNRLVAHYLSATEPGLHPRLSRYLLRAAATPSRAPQ